MREKECLLFVLLVSFIFVSCTRATPTQDRVTATLTSVAVSPLTTPRVDSPLPTKTLPPPPTETPTPFLRPTPGPTTTPFPGTPLDFETLAQGYSLLFYPPEIPRVPTFYVFSSQAEWDNFVDTYDFPKVIENEDGVLGNTIQDLDSQNRVLVLGSLFVDAVCLHTNHQVLNVWQKGNEVYLRVAWEETDDVSHMAGGIYYVLASVSWPESTVGQDLLFTFVSQWPPHYDGLGEHVAVVKKSLP